jgi:diphthine synthase
MLYLVGLGLHDEKDVTVRGKEVIEGSARVYLEAYTSILGVPRERLVRYYLAFFLVSIR